MSFMELAKNRYSERYFDARPVEQEKIDQILEAGRTAPTACNYQPQRIYVIQSEEALKKLRSIRVSHFNAPLILLVCYDAETAWCNPRDRWYENYCSGEQDATIVVTTMMYEAEELGVHNVWLRGFDSQAVAETFDLPKNHIPVMMFAMGYPSDKTKPSDWHFMRKPLEETVKTLLTLITQHVLLKRSMFLCGTESYSQGVLGGVIYGKETYQAVVYRKQSHLFQ